MKIGIDLGGSHIAIGVLNNSGYILEKVEKRLMTKEKKDIKNSIESYIIQNVKDLREKYKISEIGISVPGTVSNTEIIKSVNLGVKNYNLVENLKKEIDLPVKIMNDAKCAALAESNFGALKDYKRSIFLTLGTGIGGAVIINGQLLDTGNLPGAEFGHMIIQRDGIKCTCGKNGCFEKYASMKAFKTNLRNSLGVDETTRGQELLDMIRKNGEDEKIKPIVDEFIDYLSIGISNLINIFEPEAVGIGGSFVYFSDVFLDKLKKNITVNVPAGVDTGDHLRVPEKGPRGINGGPNGDVYIEIRVKNHELFKRDKQDLYITVPLTITEAALGCKKEIPTLDGNIILTIPAGSNTGDKHRIKSKGLKSPSRRGTGDLYAILKVIIPSKLDRKQKKLLEELDKTN